MPQHSIPTIPGYQGYIPGKKAETIVGKTFRAANEECMVTAFEKYAVRHAEYEKTLPAEQPEPKGTLGRLGLQGYQNELDSERTQNGLTKLCAHTSVPSVPGYTGFIPCKNETSTVGKTFRHANEEAGKLFERNHDSKK